ncbi:hypothetical protein F0726_01884 [Acidithiobacillus caldus]|nr:hypothetical protein F0726_01884 [Acidithiobacillus caldus]
MLYRQNPGASRHSPTRVALYLGNRKPISHQNRQPRARYTHKTHTLGVRGRLHYPFYNRNGNPIGSRNFRDTSQHVESAYLGDNQRDFLPFAHTAQRDRLTINV